MATPTSQSDPSRPEPDASGEGQVGQGVLWMTVAMACFVTMDTMAKHLVQTHSVVQVVWGRYFFCLLYTSQSPRDQRGSRMPSSA